MSVVEKLFLDDLIFFHWNSGFFVINHIKLLSVDKKEIFLVSKSVLILKNKARTSRMSGLCHYFISFIKQIFSFKIKKLFSSIVLGSLCSVGWDYLKLNTLTSYLT